jgi:hypothetical protein
MLRALLDPDLTSLYFIRLKARLAPGFRSVVVHHEEDVVLGHGEEECVPLSVVVNLASML